ncbi:MAG: DUF4349 domain-containing protein [Spirochaetia bacterium]|nr:DUF4349 domain-containing protein [Spirochaetia bacterium]
MSISARFQHAASRRGEQPRALFLLFSFIAFVAITAGSCKQRADKQSALESVDHLSAKMDSPSAEGKGTRAVGGEEDARDLTGQAQSKDKGKDSFSYLIGPGIVPMEKASGRLLEYRIEVSYNSSDFQNARKNILAVASRYGFLKSSSADAHGRLTLNAEMAVRVESMYDALKDLDTTGTLVSENITVTDHTEHMAQEKMKSDRESLRAQRRSNAVFGDPAAKNWKDREDLLEQSENARDAAEFEKWKIRDRVNWAVIAVSVQGPAVADAVEIPPYKRAFFGLISMLLWMSYGLIYLLPFILIAALVVWKRSQIAGLFRKKS